MLPQRWESGSPSCKTRGTCAAMELSLPSFQFRFMAALGNVIFPGNFHPVGSQAGARKMVEFTLADGAPKAGAGGRWLVVGGSA